MKSTGSSQYFTSIKEVYMRMRKMHIAWTLILCLGLSLAVAPSVAMAQTAPAAAKTSTSERVNLNTATAEQLQTIPGIGPAMAKRVIEYRSKVGKFGKIEEIINVKGVGEKRFQKMKDRLTV
jgi:competence protein ComEA